MASGKRALPAGLALGPRWSRVRLGMTLKPLRELRDAAPFRPFEIHLSSGRSLPVATADHLFFFPTHEEVLVVLPDGGFHFVSPDQIVSLSGKGRKPAAR